MPVNACRLIRKMRGGAQAHLLEAGDGRHYVVKFLNNPQHRRVLVNEWIASTFLRYLGIATPEVAMVRITREFLTANPEVYIQLGNGRREVEPGWHFGSCFPGDPARTVVYDFLPDTLLAGIATPEDFTAMLAFDQWMGNADSRQAIFFRARVKERGPAAEPQSERVGFVAQMVDNGFVFEGPHWQLADSPIRGVYFRPLVYTGVRGFDQFQPWLDRIVHFPEAVIDQAVKQLPPTWMEGDEDELMKLLEGLLRRRKRVPELIEACRRGRVNLFPAWR